MKTMVSLIRKLLYNTIILMMGCIVISFGIYNFASQALIHSVESSLAEIAKQGAQVIEKDMERQFAILETMAKTGRVRDLEVPAREKVELINRYFKTEEFIRISIADVDGNALTTDGKELFVGDRQYFQKALRGERSVSDPLYSRVDGSLAVVFAVPLYDLDQNIMGVLYGTYPSENISTMVDYIRLGDQGYSYIINEDGVVIAHLDRDLVYRGHSDFELLADDPSLKKLIALETQMIKRKTGAGGYTYQGIQKYMGFAPIEGTTWSIGVTSPRQEIFKDINQLLRFLLLSIIGFMGAVVIANTYGTYLKKKLQKEQTTSTNVIQMANMIVIRFKDDGTIVDCNTYGEMKTGFNRDFIVQNKNIIDLIASFDQNDFNKILNDHCRGLVIKNFEMALSTINGDKVYGIWNFNTPISDYDEEDELEIMGLDITDRVLAEKDLYTKHQELTQLYEELAATEEELREKFDELAENEERLRISEERYSLVVDATNIGIWEWDIINNRRFYSSKWYDVLEISPNQKLSAVEQWIHRIHPEDQSHFKETLNHHLQGCTDLYSCEYRVKMRDGTYKWIHAVGKTLRDEQGVPIRMAGSHEDITPLKHYQQRLEQLAYNDSLTGLPNRFAMKQILPRLLQGEEGMGKAMLFIDSDNFKLINDTLGHSIGDQLLVQMGGRLSSLFDTGDRVFRIGGDEFIVFLDSLESDGDIETVAYQILQAFEKAFIVEDSVLHISISIGISVYPEDGTSIEDLLKNADIAMYKAKEQGKNTFVAYDQSMKQQVLERVNIEKHLRSALSNNEFILYYQPQVDLNTGMVAGFEALIRWDSPELGMVSPLRFITVAEDSHLIIPLGKWVLQTACSFIKEIHRQGYINCKLSVNISILQLIQEDFVDMVMGILEEIGLDPCYLEMELTESILMESFETIRSNLFLLKDRGIKVALDDFGTGYSSLSYLKQLPISTLKIDKSFIDDIGEGDSTGALADTIITFGHKMGLVVVAEGVESQSQLEYLKIYDCDLFQGYLFSRPVPEEQALELLQQQSNQ